jgi:hypothetical protein
MREQAILESTFHAQVLWTPQLKKNFNFSIAKNFRRVGMMLYAGGEEAARPPPPGGVKRLREFGPLLAGMFSC